MIVARLTCSIDTFIWKLILVNWGHGSCTSFVGLLKSSVFEEKFIHFSDCSYIDLVLESVEICWRKTIDETFMFEVLIDVGAAFLKSLFNKHLLFSSQFKFVREFDSSCNIVLFSAVIMSLMALQSALRSSLCSARVILDIWVMNVFWRHETSTH